jgi:hypothetical protein
MVCERQFQPELAEIISRAIRLRRQVFNGIQGFEAENPDWTKLSV